MARASPDPPQEVPNPAPSNPGGEPTEGPISRRDGGPPQTPAGGPESRALAFGPVSRAPASLRESGKDPRPRLEVRRPPEPPLPARTPAERDAERSRWERLVRAMS